MTTTAKAAAHTPGPWRIDEEDGNLPNDIWDANDELLATAYPMKRDGLHDSWKANARLIAAAPEMLEALELYTKLDDLELGTDERRKLGWEVKGKIEAAIQKARGGQ